VKIKETGSIRAVLQPSYVRPLRYAGLDSGPAGIWGVEEPESPAGGPAENSAAALGMITKEKHPMRVLFLRDHEISGLRPTALSSAEMKPH
jgi:hypothetical protein